MTSWSTGGPPFRDANSAYAILTHCLGVMEYWGGATVAERPIQRDRAAEFTASGDVAGLLRRTEQARRRLREDMVGLDAAAPPVNVRRDPDDPVPYTETKGAVLRAHPGGAVPALRADGAHPRRAGGQPAPMTAADGSAVPIACSLDAAALHGPRREWRALVRVLGDLGGGGRDRGAPRAATRRMPRSRRPWRWPNARRSAAPSSTSRSTLRGGPAHARPGRARRRRGGSGRASWRCSDG